MSKQFIMLKFQHIAVLLFSGYLISSMHAANMLKNADFSSIADGKALNWRIATGWKGESHYSFADGCCLISRTDDDGGAGACFSDKIDVEALREYGLVADLKINHIDGKYNLLLDFYDAGGNLVERQKMFQLYAGTEDGFISRQAKITAPENAATVEIGLVINRRGSVAFRNIFFGNVEELPTDLNVSKNISGFADIPPSSPFNLVPNADFSELNDELPKYWSIQKSWRDSQSYTYSFIDGALVISGGTEINQAAAFACEPLEVIPEGWYHLSAQLCTENVERYASVTLQFLNGSGEVLESRRFITLWRKNQNFIRLHKILQVPANAAWVRPLAVLKGTGTARFKDFSLNGNFADREDNSKTVNLLLNGSFEEADFSSDFTDCFEVLSGSAQRSREADHGFYALKLSPGTTLSYGKDVPAIAVVGNENLYARFAATGKGFIQYNMVFYDVDGRRCGNHEQTLTTIETEFSTLESACTTPEAARYAKATWRSGDAGTVTIDSLYLGREPFVVDKLPDPVPVVEKIKPNPNAAVTPRSAIKKYQGVPTWHINGNPVVNSLYTVERVRRTSRPDGISYHKNVIAKGKFPIYVVGGPISINETGMCSISDALENLDFQIRLVLSECPDAYFVVWCHQYTSREFIQEYPSELAKVEDDFCGHKRILPAGYSYGSEIWGRLAAQSLEKFICRAREKDYGDRIVGIMPGFGQYGENNWGHIDGKYYTSPHDFSPAMTNFFRKWLFQEYKGDVKKLGKAWGRKSFNFVNAQVPNMLQRVPRLKGGFLDPETQRQVIDYARCDSYSIIHRVLQQCSAIKQVTDGNMFTVSEIGYLSLRYPHREMKEALKSNYLDAWGPAPGYTNRGAGDDIPDNAPTASLRHWNKIWMFQADVRSHRAGGVLKRFGETANSEESVAVYLREIGHYMTTGTLPYHWTFNTWYQDDQIMEVVGKFDRLMQLSSKFPRNSKAEIAVALDTLSLSAGIEFNYSRKPNTAAARLTYNRCLEWHKLGAPYDLFLLDDLLDSPDLEQYKVIIMAAVCVLSDRQRELIEERLYKNGRTVIWMYAPGIMRSVGNQLLYDINNMGITGFQLGEEVGQYPLDINLSPQALRKYGLSEEVLPVGNFRTPIYGGFGSNPENPQPLPPEQFSARFHVKPASAVDVLGVYTDTPRIAAARLQKEEYASIFWGSTALEQCILRPMLREAGVHLYSNRPAVVYANENFLVLHTSKSGEHTVNLPRQTEIVYDLFADKPIATGTDNFTIDLPAKRSLLIYFGKEAALETAITEVDAAIAARDRRNAEMKPEYAFDPIIRNLASKADLNQQYSTDSEGYIKNWLFIGPFPNFAKEEGYMADFLKTEQSVQPRPGLSYTASFDATVPERELERNSWYNGKAEKRSIIVEWQPLEFSKGITKNIAQEIDLPFKDQIVYYCACYVESPIARKAIIAVGSDDGNKTFVNSVPATAINVASRPLNPDSEKAAVNLKAGKNFLLLKVTQGTGGLGHAVRFIDPATNKKITDLKITLKP